MFHFWKEVQIGGSLQFLREVPGTGWAGSRSLEPFGIGVSEHSMKETSPKNHTKLNPFSRQERKHINLI